MDELGLFTAALGLSGPWWVTRSEFDAERTQLDLYWDNAAMGAERRSSNPAICATTANSLTPEEWDKYVSPDLTYRPPRSSAVR